MPEYRDLTEGIALRARALALVVAALVVPCAAAGLTDAAAERELPSMPLVLRQVGEADDDRFGCSVAGAGDVDGDGRAEWVIGASGWSDPEIGRAYLFSAQPPLDGLPEMVVDGVLDRGNLGARVAGLGDVNSDGFADFAARGSASVGMDTVDAVHVFLGASLFEDVEIVTLVDDQPFGYGFGIAIAGGDVNDDGYGSSCTLLGVGVPEYRGLRGAAGL